MASLVEKAGTPWGAIAGIAGQVLGSAVADVPQNVSSGSGPFMGGSLTIGARNVGSGSQDADTSASAAQTPVSESPGATVDTTAAGPGLSPVFLYVAAGVALLLTLVALFRKDD